MRAWTRRGVHALMLLGELVLLYAGLSVIFSDESGITLNLLTWNLVAFTYLGVGAVVMRRRAMRTAAPSAVVLTADASPTNAPSPDAHAADPSAPPTPIATRRADILARGHGLIGGLTHFYVALLPAVFSLLGLSAAVTVLLDIDSTTSHDQALATKAMAALVMVSAWMLLHISYSRSYRLFYLGDGGGLDFPETARPNDVDFLYFALTLGSSFATSDVSVTSTRMRWHVLAHSVMSFFYNAIILAVAFRVLTGG